jgi:geranylgeranyl diphosphate synthase type I
VSHSPAAPTTASRSGSPEAFARLIDGFRERLEREIAAFLADKHTRARLGPAGQAADAGLADPADLVDGVARLMATGGKRLRPALVYFTYRACGGRPDELALPVALATEFLHTYLLIHDDIMDHAEVRRGQPAAHLRFRDLHRASGLRGDGGDFGRSVAILLGDLAHTYAVELFNRATPPATAANPAGERWRDLAACFSTMCEEVIGGQYLEFLLAHRDLAVPAGGDAGREAELLRVLRLKSGRYTAERPIQLGALLAGAPAAVRAELSRYGTAVGEAFQLQDDLLGVFGDPATVGKPVGDDLREGKLTFLIYHALAAGCAEDRTTIAAALGNPDLTAAEVAGAQHALERSGARQMVTAMIAQRLEEARGALAAIPAVHEAAAPRRADDEDDESRQEGRLFLSGLLDYLWEREQ